MCFLMLLLYLGIWKNRFPILKRMRLHLPNAMKVVMATAILHNLSILWGEIGVEDLGEHPDLQGRDPAMPPVPNADITIDLEDLTPIQIRRLGQQTRENMRTNMDPVPTRHELRRLGRQH